MNEILFSCKQFRVEKSGEGETEKTMVHAKGGAGVIAVNHDNCLLITREYRSKIGKTIWRIPAGGQEPGEDMIDCARRELREESGYDAKKLDFFSDIDSSLKWLHQPKALFIARDLFPSPLDTGDEEIKPEVHFLAPAEVLKLLNDGEFGSTIGYALYRFLHVEKLI